LGPLGPDAAQDNPEYSVEVIQSWTGPFPLENDDLLPQGKNLQGGFIPTAEENSDSGQKSEDELAHESEFVARVTSSSKVCYPESQVAHCKT
jgi:hypothetical protein